MAETQKAPPSPASQAYSTAIRQLADGDFTTSIKALLEVQEKYPDTEEAYFVEEQLARVRRNWPAEAEKAGLTNEAWAALQARAAARRAGTKPPQGAFGVITLLVVVAAWCLAVTFAPHAAFLGKVDEVPLIFRIVSCVVGLVSAATAFGLMKLKWEAVNAFIVLAPVYMVITFIGVTSSFEAHDVVAKIICLAALAAEIAAAWYMSKQSHRFIY